MNLRILTETANSVTVGWDPVPNASGFRFFRDAVPVSSSFDGSKTSVKFGKPDANPHVYEVRALVYGDSGTITVPTPTPPPTVGLPKYGVSPGAATASWSNTDHAWVMDKMKELAQGKPFAWRIDCYGPGAKLDRDIQGCLTRGVTPYLIVGGTNRNPSPNPPVWLPTLAAQYKGQGLVYTGPNEPDLGGWNPTMLATHCQAIYNTIKQADPTAPVGYGALWKGSPNSFTSWTPYIEAAATTAHDAFADGMFMAFHGYDDPAQATPANQSWNIWTWYFRKFGGHVGHTAEDIFAAHGLTNIRYVNDESGGKEADPAYTQKCMRLLDQAKTNVCHGSFIYCVLPDVPGFNYLLNPDHTERPCYPAYKTFMATA